MSRPSITLPGMSGLWSDLSGCIKSSTSVPHTSFGSNLAGFDIGSIETRHETSSKPSNSLGDDDLASWSHTTGNEWSPLGVYQIVNIGPTHEFLVELCGF